MRIASITPYTYVYSNGTLHAAQNSPEASFRCLVYVRIHVRGSGTCSDAWACTEDVCVDVMQLLPRSTVCVRTRADQLGSS
jgi:hypothetical protein